MTLIEQVATYAIENFAIGTAIGTDVFLGRIPENESTPVSCIAFIDTGGPTPEPEVPIKSPTFQVFIRATDYDAGKAKIDLVRQIHGLYGELVSGETYFYFIYAQSEGGHLGKDEAGRDLFSMNFICNTR